VSLRVRRTGGGLAWERPGLLPDSSEGPRGPSASKQKSKGESHEDEPNPRRRSGLRASRPRFHHELRGADRAREARFVREVVPRRARPQGRARGQVNLNTASASELASLPGVGDKLAARIVEHRQKVGGFKSTQEIMNVKGVGEKNFTKIQSYLTVGGAAR
jgi:competence ComEA-like helix-hairpin-helix protein